MSSSNCCFLTCIQISQEAGQVVWCSHLFQNFPQFIVIHTVKGFGIVKKAEIDVFLELCCLGNQNQILIGLNFNQLFLISDLSFTFLGPEKSENRIQRKTGLIQRRTENTIRRFSLILVTEDFQTWNNPKLLEWRVFIGKHAYFDMLDILLGSSYFILSPKRPVFKKVTLRVRASVWIWRWVGTQFSL